MELLEQMKAPITDQSTPEISDEENENLVHFTDKARLIFFRGRTKTDSVGRQTR